MFPDKHEYSRFSILPARLAPCAEGYRQLRRPGWCSRAQIGCPRAESVLHEGRKQPNIRATSEVTQEIPA